MKVQDIASLEISSSCTGNDQLLTEHSTIDVEESAMYQAYLDQPVQSISMCNQKPRSKCMNRTLQSTNNSAKDLFTSSYIGDATLDRDCNLATCFCSWVVQDCPAQPLGFNVGTATKLSGGAASNDVSGLQGPALLRRWEQGGRSSSHPGRAHAMLLAAWNS